MRYLVLFFIPFSLSATVIEAPISNGEVKILYPCEILNSLELEKEEEEKILFFEKDKNEFAKVGLIYRIQENSEEIDITLKVRSLPGESLLLRKDIYNSLKDSKDLKCESDILYDPLTPKFISSCSYKTLGSTLTEEHFQFLKMTNKEVSFSNLRSVEVLGRKWKLSNKGSLLKKASIEVWNFRGECLLEASAKFKGMNNALPTLRALENVIPHKPSAVQGDKTSLVLGQ